ncbi:DUF771 domain-containing protein [Enterococcus faecium]|nr:DUF771 domain-containing protein [Enterococcus faecium]EGP5366369.1 DUF771 domain-containing protein [Enterococcus faecium]NTQ55494.1 DUF771 domain-containing protein [Enterococcus faecium]
MQQALDLDIQVVIPEKFVLVEREEYDSLKKASAVGNWAKLETICNKTNVSKSWFITNVLQVPKYKKELSVENNGFVKYPSSKGSPYLFHESRMMEWLDKKFAEIMKNSE